MTEPPRPAPVTEPFDALLLLSFGGPEKPKDVVPFLENVTRGRGIPKERLAEVGEHYFKFGGRSPINDQCRALLAAISADFAAHDIELPVYWGNRNWHPFLADTTRQLVADGRRRVAVLPTSAYSSYSSCRQYRENLAAAAAEVTEGPQLHRLRQYFNHPGFVEPFVDAVVQALEELPGPGRGAARLVFVTHSIPTSMNDTSGPQGGAYVAQHADVANLVSDRVAQRTGVVVPHDLVYCSRSGPPQVPWLTPDINDHFEALAASGERPSAVVVVPIGFVSDHMEVIYDLDTEAKATAERLGIPMVRVPTPGTDPRFVAMVRDLVTERAAQLRGETPEQLALGDLGAWSAVCSPNCCPNARAPQTPALEER